jgi:FKBP-type peptidyl-prolyl cis-trans isomerase FkpA
MKNILSAFIILSAVFISCSKDEACTYNDSTITASASETTSVESYLNTAGITGTQKHPSGFYYKITQAGSGSAVVNLCSKITIKYVGKLTNGTVFDQTTGAETRIFTLGGLIPGWQKGIPLISSGGKITLYIPPSLGYGSTPRGSIPANSILIFDIELISVS